MSIDRRDRRGKRKKMERDEIECLLISVARTLALLDTNDLKRHVDECDKALNRLHSFGAILDPTAYRNSLQSGELEDAKHQLEITKGLLTAKEAIDKRENAIREHVKRLTE